MERVGVSSSNIESVGFEDGVLEVEFKHGGVYQYENVPKSVFDGLMSAESLGSFFATNVRKEYPATKVE